MRRTWTAVGAALLMAGFAGVIGGLWIITTIPAGWMYGAFLLLISLAFIAFALGSKQKVREESEKPVMDIATGSDEEEES